MRTIVHLAWEFPPDIVGGLGVHVAGLARFQASGGDRVVIVTPQGAGKVQGGAEGGPGRARVVRAGRRPGPHGGPFLWQVEAMWAGLLAGALGELGARPRPGPLVIHAHDWLVAGAALRLAREWGAPLVTTYHATEMGRRGRMALSDGQSRAVTAWERRLAEGSALRFAPSTSLAREVAALDGGPCDVVAGGFDPFDVPLSRIPRPGRILLAARLVADKGTAVLLRALGHLAGEGTRFDLEIAGTGPEETHLKLLVRRLGLGACVAWLGQLDAMALAERRRQAWVCVAPSLYEPFGLSALEGVVAGVPLVASRVGGLGEWAAPVARLATPGDPISLAGALSSALSERNRPDLKGVRERIGSLAWPETAARLRALLDPLLPR